MRGLRCSVYRPRSRDDSFDPSNGGLSSKFDDVWVLDLDGYAGASALPKIPEDALKKGNLVKVLARQIFGSEYRCLVPCGPDGADLDSGGMVGPMCGGSLVSTHDGRWKTLTGCEYALGLHDRFETQAEYDLLSM